MRSFAALVSGPYAESPFCGDDDWR